jgi:Bacterial PH domain
MSDDFDFETKTGLPDRLPDDEHVIWQGSPGWRALARRVFHADKVALYFAAALSLRVAHGLYQGQAGTQIAGAVAILIVAAALAFALIVLLAWRAAATTVYTLTTRRIIMRYGIALPITLNIPLSRIEAASLALARDGSGDIAIQPEAETRLAYLMLWPHARAWHVAHPEPSLRCVSDANRIARLIGDALLASAAEQAVTTIRVRPVASAVKHPYREPVHGLVPAE